MFAVPVEASPPFHHRQDLLRARLQAVGDSGLLVEFGTKIAPDVQARVLELDESLKQRCFAGVIEAIIGYTTLLIVFDPARTDFQRLKDEVLSLAAAPGRRTRRPRRWRVPVAYGGTFGMDLEEAAARCGLSQQELTNAHAGAHYVGIEDICTGIAHNHGMRTCPIRRAQNRAQVGRLFNGFGHDVKPVLRRCVHMQWLPNLWRHGEQSLWARPQRHFEKDWLGHFD